MARLARLTLAGVPHHVVLRGNNRQAIFFTAQDYALMHRLLVEQARAQAVEVHAYVFMPNHLHLLLTPQRAESLPLFMQAVGRSYVRSFNLRHGRSGTLWEGRYRCALLQASRYLLPCMAYLDWHPVRQQLASQPAQYPWSSCAHHSGLRSDPLVTPHPLYWALGNTPFAREAAYAQCVHHDAPAALRAQLLDSALSGWALGDAEFTAQLQAQTARRVHKARPGRPRKAAAAAPSADTP